MEKGEKRKGKRDIKREEERAEVKKGELGRERDIVQGEGR